MHAIACLHINLIICTAAFERGEIKGIHLETLDQPHEFSKQSKLVHNSSVQYNSWIVNFLHP